jgi:hypothetical protein
MAPTGAAPTVPAGYPSVLPMAAQPLPGAANRGYMMTGGLQPPQPQPQPQQQPQPASGKDAPSAERKSPFDPSVFR